MVNLLLNAITKRLGTSFGTSYHYYVEDVEQGFTKPCFKVDVLVPIVRSKSPVLYDRTMPIVIHFFSDSEEDVKKQLYSMGEEIVELLEYLPFSGTTLRGESISFQVTENVLQVFVTYKYTTVRSTDNMDELFDELEISASTPKIPIEAQQTSVFGRGVLGILQLGNY